MTLRVCLIVYLSVCQSVNDKPSSILASTLEASYTRAAKTAVFKYSVNIFFRPYATLNAFLWRSSAFYLDFISGRRGDNYLLGTIWFIVATYILPWRRKCKTEVFMVPQKENYINRSKFKVNLIYCVWFNNANSTVSICIMAVSYPGTRTNLGVSGLILVRLVLLRQTTPPPPPLF